MSRLLLATPDLAFEQRVRQALDLSNGQVRRIGAELLAMHPSQAVKAVGGDPLRAPDLVALGPGLDTERALELARRFDERHPEIHLVLVAEPSPELWSEAARAGIRELVSPDASAAELHEVLERAAQRAARHRANVIGEPDAEGSAHQLITVVSPKGGSGKTTLATNLAIGLATAAPGDVVLVDLDLLFGDVANALSLVPEHNIADAARNLERLDAMGLKVFLTPYEAGFFALCAPDDPALGEQVSPAQSTAILQVLTSEFRYVIVDTPAGLAEHSLAAIEVSTDILTVCTMDVPSVRSLRKLILAIDKLGMTSQHRHFVLNRADARVGLDPADVERTVGLTIDAAVSSSRSVPLAMNQGLPLLLAEPRSAVAKQLRGIVERFLPRPAEPSGRAGRRRSAR